MTSTEKQKGRRRWPWVIAGIFVLLTAIGAILPSEHKPPAAVSTTTTQVRAKVHSSVKTRPVARPKAKSKPECEPFPKCKREAEAVEAEVKKGEEYARIHRPEQEAKQKEYERRARGEFTPEEEKHNEQVEQEAGEVESVLKKRRAEETANALEGAAEK